MGRWIDWTTEVDVARFGLARKDLRTCFTLMQTGRALGRVESIVSEHPKGLGACVAKATEPEFSH
jgi:hypothetical protein